MEALDQLMHILGHDFTTNLISSLAMLPAHSSPQIKVNAEICIPSPDLQETGQSRCHKIYLGTIDLHQSDVQQYLLGQLTDDRIKIPVTNCEDIEGSAISTSNSNATEACVAKNQPPYQRLSRARNRILKENLKDHNSNSDKRRKTTGGLTVRQAKNAIAPASDITNNITPMATENSTTRQLQKNFREFPQRKRKSNQDIHELQPISVQKFFTGLWKQIFSGVQLSPISLDDPHIPSTVGSIYDANAFRAINSLCLNATKMSKCSRALETVIQAHWVDCYEARVKAIGLENPFLSDTETKMAGLSEACTILQWSEKELRNKLSIWRGYREIKDAGGWASLVFAGSGIYRFCKYRVAFGNNLSTALKKLQFSIEVAADTLHPEWRRLLNVIGKESEVLYSGHPHDWVICDGEKPITLKSTYSEWVVDFQFTHLDNSKLDQNAWGTDDPRQISSTNSMICSSCGSFQSNSASYNKCRCFPELYGGYKGNIPIQVFRTHFGKNNGLIARCQLPRGSAIGEFIGLITKGFRETDVMQGGDQERQYQIYQGNMGNYTRFVNHSCAPNSQFQKFTWLGVERIILVSRGIEADVEITVDYSQEYWEGLDKECLCGELCCRYSKKKAKPT